MLKLEDNLRQFENSTLKLIDFGPNYIAHKRSASTWYGYIYLFYPYRSQVILIFYFQSLTDSIINLK